MYNLLHSIDRLYVLTKWKPGWKQVHAKCVPSFKISQIYAWRITLLDFVKMGTGMDVRGKIHLSICLALLGSKPLHEPMLTKFYDAIWHH